MTLESGSWFNHHLKPRLAPYKVAVLPPEPRTVWPKGRELASPIASKTATTYCRSGSVVPPAIVVKGQISTGGLDEQVRVRDGE